MVPMGLKALQHVLVHMKKVVIVWMDYWGLI